MLRIARGLTDQLLEEICAGRDLGAGHLPISSGKTIAHSCKPESSTIVTDEGLLGRVLGNLIKNALEASSAAQTVGVQFDGGPVPTFSVHNEM